MSKQSSRALLRTSTASLIAVLALAVAQVPFAFGATSVESVVGSAYGVSASVKLGLLTKSIGPVPTVTLASSGGSKSATKASATLSAGLTEVLDTGLINVTSESTGVGGPSGQVESSSVLADVALINSIIQADAVTASCDADVDGANGRVSLVNARVAGIGGLSASPSPNTGIFIAGVGNLTLNKQSTDSNGTITVTALSLNLLPVLGTGTLNIGSVKCGTETVVSTTTTIASTTSTTNKPTTTSPPSTLAPTTTSTVAKSTTSTSKPITTTTLGEGTTTVAGDQTTTTLSIAAAGEEEENWCSDDSETSHVLAFSTPDQGGPPTASLVTTGDGSTSWIWLAVVGGFGIAAGGLLGRVDWSRASSRFQQQLRQSFRPGG